MRGDGASAIARPLHVGNGVSVRYGNSARDVGELVRVGMNLRRVPGSVQRERSVPAMKVAVKRDEPFQRLLQSENLSDARQVDVALYLQVVGGVRERSDAASR